MDAPATPAAMAATTRAWPDAGHRALAYRPEIDGLRAVAVLPVVFYHVGVSAFGGGFVGVDVFFVISGYLITGILKRELEADSFSLTGFYKRRVRRIVPALFVMSAAVAWASYRWLPPSQLISVADALASVGLFAANVYFYLHAGYWDAAARDHPLLHTWSLGVEEQFYIVFPLLLFALSRWLPTPRLALAGLGLASLAASAWASGAAPEADFYLIPFRAFELIIGALIAYGAVQPPSSRWKREGAAAAGLVLIAVSVFGFSQATPFPGVAALVPCAGAGLVILAGAGGPTAATGLLASPPMRFVGLISYSLYLWHWPLIVFARDALGRPFTLPEQGAIAAAAFVVATLSWAFVERPFRRRGGRFPVTAVATGLGVAGVALGLFVAQQAAAHRGWPNRLPPDLATANGDARKLWRDGECFLEKDQGPSDWKGEACVIAGARPGRVLWWGDSFASQYTPALVAARGDLPFSVIPYAYAGCAPVFGFHPAIAPHCEAFNDHALAVIAANRTTVVVLAARWEAAIKRGLTLDALDRTVEALRARGLTVVLIGQSPTFAADVTRILAWRRRAGGTGPAAEPATVPPSLNVSLAAAGADVFVDPMPALCQRQLCQLSDGRQAWFADDGHLSLAGAQRVLPYLLPPIERAVAARPPPGADRH